MQAEAITDATSQPKRARRCVANPVPLPERRAAKAREAAASHFAGIDPDRTITHAELLAKLNEVVREARFESELAAVLGVSPQLVNHIRNGRQGIGTKLAAALGYEMRVSYAPLRRDGDAG
jgi:hypothetical protein